MVCYRLEDVGLASGGVIKPRSIDQGHTLPIEGKCGRFYVNCTALERITDSES